MFILLISDFAVQIKSERVPLVFLITLQFYRIEL